MGPEYCYRTLPHVCLRTGERTEKSLGDYFNQMIEDMMYRILNNPLISINARKYINREIFEVDKRMFENCRVLRGFVGEIVEDRKRRTDLDADDLVSLILEDPSYQEVEEIIDDVLILFMAGSKTTQATTSNLISFMLHEPEQF